jgi:hypothetical protein
LKSQITVFRKGHKLAILQTCADDGGSRRLVVGRRRTN